MLDFHLGLGLKTEFFPLKSCYPPKSTYHGACLTRMRRISVNFACQGHMKHSQGR